MSFLAIEGLHVFVTGASGGIGQAIVKELIANGCRVTAHDLRELSFENNPHIFTVQGDITSEPSVSSCIAAAIQHFGPINILAANAGITERVSHPIWRIPLDFWERTNRINVTGTFLTIKHFLLQAESFQEQSGKELDNLAIVLTGSVCGKLGLAGHAEYASGKAGLQYGLVRGVKNEIVRLNRRARINAVAPGWVDTPLVGDLLDPPGERWVQTESTVALKKMAQPEDIARAVAFLSSHRAAGHVTGECIGVDGGMEGRIVWRESEIKGSNA